MDLQLTGRRALVMSSSRGLGAGIARALAAEGAEVLLTGRSGDRLAALAAEITAAGPGRASHVVADLTDPGSAAVLADAADAMDGVDILVANTGGPPPGRMVDIDPAMVPAQLDTMVVRVIEVAARLVPGMRARGWGRIVVVASSGVVQPIPTLGLSNLARSALVGWAKSMAGDLAAEGITVNMLLPGRIHTARLDELDSAAATRTNTTLEEVREASRAAVPAGRYGTVEEFAATAAFLCSGPASYVTGSMVRCDGGLIRSV